MNQLTTFEQRKHTATIDSYNHLAILSCHLPIQVQHCGGGFGGVGTNGASSSKDSECIDSWLGGEKWDVVTINAGLDDCTAPGGFDEAAYSANVRVVLTKAAAAAGRVVFVSTTPVGSSGGSNSTTRDCILKANTIAQQIVAQVNSSTSSAGRVAFVDLHGHVEAFCGANYTECAIQLDGGSPYFSTAWTPPWPVDSVTKQPLQSGPKPSGQQYTALFVARAIQRAVPAAKIQPPINVSAATASATLVRTQLFACLF